jgi:hypothetical protein
VAALAGLFGCVDTADRSAPTPLVPVAYFEGELSNGALRIWLVEPPAGASVVRDRVLQQALTPTAEDRNGTRGTAAIADSIEFAVENPGSPFQGEPLGVVPLGCGDVDSASFAVTVRSFFPNGLAATHAQITSITSGGAPAPQNAFCNSERTTPSHVDDTGAPLDATFGLIRFGNLRPRTTAISTPISTNGLTISKDPTASTMVWKFRNGNFRFEGRVLGNACGADQCQTGFVAGEGIGVATASPAFWEPDGPVRAVAEADGLVYVGGDFDVVAPRTGRSARFDLASTTPATPVRPFAIIENNAVFAVAPDGAGGYYAGGTFTLAQHRDAARLVHILADGNLDAGFQPIINGQVNGLHYAAAQNRLYIGGNFSDVGGAVRLRGAAVDGTTGAVDAFNPSFNNVVNAVVGDADSVYFGGNYTTVNGITRGRVVAFDIATGALSDRPFSHANGVVFAMAIDEANGRLFTGGSFQIPSARIAGWDTATGALLPGFRAVSNVNVTSIASGNGAVFVGSGAAFALNGLPRQGVGAVNPLTGATLPFAPLAPGAVRSIAVDGSTVIIGGDFLTVNAVARQRVAGLDFTDIASPVLTDFAPTASGTVRALSVDAARRLFVGTDNGPYIGGVRRSGLVALDLATGEPTDFVADVDGSVSALAVDSGGNVIVGGDVAGINGVARTKLASVAPNGTVNGLSTAFGPGDSINAVAVSGTDIIVGGAFATVNGQPRLNIARLSSAGAVDLGFNLIVDGAINTLDVDNGELLVGGAFNVPGARLAVVDENTGALVTNLNANGDVFGARFNADAIYATGAFSTVLGQGTGNVAAINRFSSTVRWVSAVGGVGNSLTVAGNGVVIAGSVGGTGVAELSARTGTVIGGFDDFVPIKSASTANVAQTIAGFTFVGRGPINSVQTATPGVGNQGANANRAFRSSFIGAHAN